MKSDTQVGQEATLATEARPKHDYDKEITEASKRLTEAVGKYMATIHQLVELLQEDLADD